MATNHRPKLQGGATADPSSSFSPVRAFTSPIAHRLKVFSEGVEVIQVKGRIDHEKAGALEAALSPHLEGPEADGHPPLLLDMAGVSFLTSAGLRVLMIAAKTCKAQQRPIAVTNLQPMIAEVVRISRFDLIIPVYPSVADAMAAISPSSSPASRK